MAFNIFNYASRMLSYLFFFAVTALRKMLFRPGQSENTLGTSGIKNFRINRTKKKGVAKQSVFVCMYRNGRNQPALQQNLL